MLKKNKKLYVVIPILLTIAAGIVFAISNLSKHKDLRVKNNIVQGKKLRKNNELRKTINNLDSDPILHVLKDVQFYLNGKMIASDCEILQKAQRYYIPIEQITNNLGATFFEDKENITIFFNDIQYSIYKKDGVLKETNIPELQLRGSIISKSNKTYLSLSDIEYIFNLVDNWDYDKKQIFLYESRGNTTIKKSETSGKAALIRLEDFAAGEVMFSSESLKKMKIIIDYLYSEQIRFHVAWIPRYMDPDKGIDNNLLEIESMPNAQFVSVLDYMIQKGALIGLHGYTHQHDNTKSIINVELSSQFNNDFESTTKIVEASLKAAAILNIPASFFETPHYTATESQQSVIERYFDYIYEPYVGLWNKKPVVSLRNKHTIYVPTTLGYIVGSDATELIKSIENRPIETLASFFYHPSKEFDFIRLSINKDGYVSYTYSGESPIHKLVKTLKENGYVTTSLSQIK